MLIYVFGFVLPFAKSAHVFQKLSLTRFADFVSTNCSSDSKAFLRFVAFSGSPTAVYRPLHALQSHTVGMHF